MRHTKGLFSTSHVRIIRACIHACAHGHSRFVLHIKARGDAIQEHFFELVKNCTSCKILQVHNFEILKFETYKCIAAILPLVTAMRPKV
jgi:hypothetical protein